MTTLAEQKRIIERAAIKSKRQAWREHKRQQKLALKGVTAQERRANYSRETNGAVDDLPPGTIIEMVCLQNGRWWGRIRRAGIGHGECESGRPIGLVFKLAKAFETSIAK